MTDLYLIAHKVRGEPAFDIAEQMECPLCHGNGCFECNDCGYWWIVPTSGHRAYPFDDYPFDAIEGLGLGFDEVVGKTMPPGLPDHYGHSTAPREGRLAALLATLPPAPVKPFKRRF